MAFPFRWLYTLEVIGGIFHVREHFSRFVGPVIETEENQPHQSLRLQVHQRARKVDKDCKAISTEYLKFPTPTEVAVVGIDSFKNSY